MSVANKPMAATPRVTEQELTATFRTRQADLQAIVAKISELEREGDEHTLVIETLKEAYATEPTRKCFRLMGGVLVERTVQDVLPELEGLLDSLKEVMSKLMETYKKREAEFSEWQRANNIVVKQR